MNLEELQRDWNDLGKEDAVRAVPDAPSERSSAASQPARVHQFRRVRKPSGLTAFQLAAAKAA